jgi:acid stress-induced BolA-like protein IbaG/YrbA
MPLIDKEIQISGVECIEVHIKGEPEPIQIICSEGAFKAFIRIEKPQIIPLDSHPER